MKYLPKINSVGLILLGALIATASYLLIENDAYARLDVVDRIADAEIRNRGGGLPMEGPEDPKDIAISSQIRAEFSRCSGQHKLDQRSIEADIVLEILEESSWESRRKAFRWQVANQNSIFKLKSLQICRAMDRCEGEWWTYVDHPNPRFDKSSISEPTQTDEGRLQIAKDYACGLAARLARKVL